MEGDSNRGSGGRSLSAGPAACQETTSSSPPPPSFWLFITSNWTMKNFWTNFLFLILNFQYRFNNSHFFLSIFNAFFLSSSFYRILCLYISLSISVFVFCMSYSSFPPLENHIAKNLSKYSRTQNKNRNKEIILNWTSSLFATDWHYVRLSNI